MSKSNVEAHIALLGKTAKDKITGFVGVVASVSFDLYGCVQAVLTPPVDKDGKTRDGHWFDVHRLEVTDQARTMPLPKYAPPAAFEYGPAEKPGRPR